MNPHDPQFAHEPRPAPPGVAAQELAALALAACPHPMLVADARSPGFPVLYANAALCRRSGLEAGAITGPDWLFLQQGARAGAQAALRAALAERCEQVLLLPHRSGDGVHGWSELRVTPLADRHGEARQLLATFTDVTELHSCMEKLAFHARHDPPAGLPPSPVRQKRTLLLVDDEQNIVSALKRLLRRDEYDILTANSGQEGLDVLAGNAVDVIVSDQRMPGMLGADFLRAAKGLYPHTIRIMLSGYTELQSVTDAVNEGAIYKFLTKPWDDDLLRGHIAEAFRLKEIADENERLNLELRSANHELAAANRKMEQLLAQKQQQLARGEISLNVARELLQWLPLPVIGLDDEGMVAFINAAADELFGKSGALLGNEAALVLPALFPDGLAGGATQRAVIAGQSHHVVVHPMGVSSQSRGSLITISRAGQAP